jgi:diguanylate cyclase (GGDEF)-like protein
MSLIRQVWLLVMVIITGGCIGGIGVSIKAAQQYIETQVSLKNSDNAQSLALTLSQLKGDASLLELGISAQFDTGHYKRISLKSPDGKTLIDRQSDAEPAVAPVWFSRAVPLHPQAGVAQVSSGWTQLGQLEVLSHTAFAYDDLWLGAVRMALWMVALGGVTAVLGLMAVRRLRRPLDAVVAQAQALSERRFVQMPEPKTPDLRRVAQALNAMVERLRLLFGEQVAQVEALRHQAHCDELTGLAHRRQFMAAFEEELYGEAGALHGHLILMRVLDLADVNRRLGHVRTDELLQELAKSLVEPVGSVQLPMVGRLNGSDFGLMHCLPGGRAELALSLLERLEERLSNYVDVAVVASLVPWQRGDRVANVMAAADAALARAEARGPFQLEAEFDRPVIRPSIGGEDAWRRQLESAVLEQRARLVMFPVLSPSGLLLHMECPLRLQLHDGGEFEPAAQWLPYAMRTLLTTRTDEVALTLALQGIAADGLPRCIHVSAVSLRDATFLPRLRSRLAAAGEAARLVWVEVSVSATEHQSSALAELIRQLRPLGVRIGVEHAGAEITSSPALLDLGLDYVKLAASVVVDVSSEPARATLVTRTTRLLHSLGLKVYAEGVANEDDLAALWQCGLDAATGPAVRI